MQNDADHAARAMGAEALPEVVLITGMSGAGRGSAARIMEELGWFVVDNLAPALIPEQVRLCAADDVGVDKIAIVSDIRSRSFAWDIRQVVRDLRAMGVDPRLVFLECGDDVLIRRYDQHRLAHPLQGAGTLSHGVHAERALLAGVKDAATFVIDTTSMSVHQLRRRLEEAFCGADAGLLRVTVQSFGFKYGVPLDADMVVDMRFLPNPYWVRELRELDGTDPAVSRYVFDQDGIEEFLGHYLALLGHMAVGYRREGKRYVLLGVGCTGGKHRSVAVAGRLAELISERSDVAVNVIHRDLGRE